MISDGIKVIVLFLRSDIYGNELYNSTKHNFEKLCEKIEGGVNYTTPYRDFCHKFTQN
jgi:hypothetical protein